MEVARAEAGSTLGTYVLERKLGAGGMAEVFLARKTGPHGFTKRVAIKRILPELSKDAQLIQMFCDEARIAATLSHPNIAQVIEFGEDDGELFIVMEYVDGPSCSALLRAATQKGEAIPTAGALYIAREVLMALAFAHEAHDEHGRALKIVHRDISPSNVLVSRIGTVKLIDFGITRSRIAERRAHPGELKGKLRYMSPEQILGSEVDARSDLFAVGIVLAEMLAGRVLFTGKNDLDVLTRISRGELGLVRDGVIPQDLAELLETALGHRPADRFQTAREFARAIEDVCVVRGIRLDDTAIVPYLHATGVLPSSSGTRPLSGQLSGQNSAAPSSRRPVPPPLPSSPFQGPPSSGPGPLSVTSREGRHPGTAAPPSSPTTVPVLLDDAGFLLSPPPDSLGRAELVSGPALPLVSRHPTDGTPSNPLSSPGRASGTYRVRTRSGNVVSLRRAEMLALIATGRLSARSHVSLKEEGFVTVNRVPALSALAAHPAYRFRDDDATSPEWLARIDAVQIPMSLYRLAIQKRTGLLVVVDGKRRKRVFLDKGDPVFVASTNRDELLGRRLVASNVVSEKDIERALSQNPPHRLGEALVAAGVLGAAQLVRELARQLEDRLIDVGSVRSGEIRFFPELTLDQQWHLRTREPTLELMTRLVREQYAPGDIAALLRPITRERLHVAPSLQGVTPLLGLSEDERRVLNVAGGQAVRDIVTRSTQDGVPMAVALRALFIGLCSGVLMAKQWPPEMAETAAARAD
jgi:serine/threonine-protein kinase